MNTKEQSLKEPSERTPESVGIRMFALYLLGLSLLTFVLGILFTPAILSRFSSDGTFDAMTMRAIGSSRSSLFAVGGVTFFAGVLTMLVSRNRMAIAGGTKVNLFLLFASILWCLAVTEIALRANRRFSTTEVLEQSPAFVPSALTKHQFDSTRQFLRRPNTDGDADKVFRILTKGFTRAEFSVQKRPGVTRCFVVGGSHVYDPNADLGMDWPTLTEKKLHAMGFSHVEVVNAGVGGWKTFDMLGRFVGELHLYQPDFVIVCATYNDLKYFRWLTPDSPPIRGLTPTVAATHQEIGWMTKILEKSQIVLRVRDLFNRMTADRIRTADLDYIERTPGLPTKMRPTPYALAQYQLNIRLLVDGIREAGVTPILISEPRLLTSGSIAGLPEREGENSIGLPLDVILACYTQCDSVLRAVAEDKDVLFFDMSSACSGYSEYFSDLIHYTPRGSDRASTELAKFLYAVITTRAPDSP